MAELPRVSLLRAAPHGAAAAEVDVRDLATSSGGVVLVLLRHLA